MQQWDRNYGRGKRLARLDEWRIISVQEGTQHLVGIVSCHPRLREGARIVTSAIRDFCAERHLAETEHTFYLLGRAGSGELPDEWAKAVKRFLMAAWGTERA